MTIPTFERAHHRMLVQAAQAKRKPHWGLQILIFIGIMIVTLLTSGLIGGIPTYIYMFTKVGIGAFLAATQNPELMASLIEKILSGDGASWMIVFNLFGTVAEIIIPVLFCKFIEKRSMGSMGFFRKNWLGSYGAGFGIGVLMICSAALLTIVTGTGSIKFNPNFSALFLVLFLIGFLIQGMAEEVLLRGYFMVSLANRAPIALAVGVNSVIFSALHLLNPNPSVLAMTNIGLFGVFASLYTLRIGNLWGIGAIHSAWNYFQGNILGAEVSGMPVGGSLLTFTPKEGAALINGGAFGFEGGLCTTVVLVAGIVILLLMKNRPHVYVESMPVPTVQDSRKIPQEDAI